MDTGFLHLHHTVIGLFFVFLLLKVGLLVAGKHDLLGRIRDKTKWVDAVLGVLILVTGGYLAFASPAGFKLWAIVKYVVVLAAIPLGIVGLRKLKYVPSILAVVLLLYAYMASTRRDVILRGEEARIENRLQALETSAAQETDVERGQVIYEEACQRCHGADGKAGYRKSKNLQTTGYTKQGIMQIVQNGVDGAAMPAYPYMSKQQRSDVAAYVVSLKGEQKPGAQGGPNAQQQAAPADTAGSGQEKTQ
jgi:mono/diheme cytochrome c family protein